MHVNPPVGIGVLTTLGDTIYGAAAGVPTRLPGNTTTTKKFYTQTGTGTVSAAPAWATLVAGDIPDLSGVYQPLNSNLTALAGLTPTTDNFIVSVSSAWASRTPAQVRTTLGLVIGTNVQAWDADLDAIALLAPSNDDIIQRKAGVWTNRTMAQLASDLGITSGITALTGDVTASGSGSVAATIANGVVTLAKMANMATASLLGRNTAGTGAPEVLSAATAKSLLSLNNVENTALSTWAGTSNITTLGTIATGTWSATAIGVTKGGTGLTGTTANQLLYSSATNTIAGLATANNAVLVTSAGGVPSLAATGSSLAVVSSVLNTIQDIRTSAGPQFANLGIGGAANSTIGGLIVYGGGAVGDASIKLFTASTGTTNSDGFNFSVEDSSKDVYINQREAANVFFYCNGSEQLKINSGGGITLGSPTGGAKGTGTLNATAVYDDNVLLTDWLFDLHYDGKAKDDDKFYRGQTLYALCETRSVTEESRRLPWMPTRAEFEQERHLGGMVSRLWQGQEQQQLYIFEIEQRIRELERGNQ